MDKDQLKRVLNQLIPFTSMTVFSKEEYNVMRDNYDLFNNILNQQEFDKICNYLNLQVDTFTDVLPYNKVYQYVNVLLGEELKRPTLFTPVATSNESIKNKNLELKEAYAKAVSNVISIKMEEMKAQSQGASEEQLQQLQQQYQEMLTPDDIDVNNFMSQQEILASRIIKYAKFKHKIDTIKNDAFKHYLVGGREIIYVGFESGQPTIKVLNPLYTFYEKSGDNKYIQDGDWAGHVFLLTAAEAYRMYSKDMTPEDDKRFKERYHIGTADLTGNPLAPSMEYHRENTEDNKFLGQQYKYHIEPTEGYNYMLNFSRRQVYVTHLEIKLPLTVTFLSYTDEYGEIKKEMVKGVRHPEGSQKINTFDEHGNKTTYYTWINPDGVEYTAEYIDIPYRYEITRLDTDIYVRARPVPYQYISLDDPFTTCKLSYHGANIDSTNAPNVSIVSRMKPAYYLYLAVMWQIGELVAKTVGPVIGIDTSQIEVRLGNKVEGGNYDFDSAVTETLALIRKGINVYNSFAGTQGNGIGVSGRQNTGDTKVISAGQDLINMVNVAQYLEEEIGKAAGVSPQRVAQFSANTNVTDNQQAIVQSSHITERYFHNHDAIWGEVMSSYVNNFVGWAKRIVETKDEPLFLQYALPNQSRELLMIDKDTPSLADIATFINTAGGDYAYYDKIESLLGGLAGQEDGILQISKILKARSTGTSPEEIHKMLEEQSAMNKKFAQQQQQAQAENEQKIIKMQDDIADKQLERDIQKIRVAEEERRETEVLIAELKNNSVDAELAAAKILHDQEKSAIDTVNKAVQIQQQDRSLDQKDEELNIKREQANKKPVS